MVTAMADPEIEGDSQLIARLGALALAWDRQQHEYPPGAAGDYAAAAVRCCIAEVRAILESHSTPRDNRRNWVLDSSGETYMPADESWVAPSHHLDQEVQDQIDEGYSKVFKRNDVVLVSIASMIERLEDLGEWERLIQLENDDHPPPDNEVPQ
jgi:hypothetical protein